MLTLHAAPSRAHSCRPQAWPHPCTSCSHVSLAARHCGHVEPMLSPRGMRRAWLGRVPFLKAKGLQQVARSRSSKAGCGRPMGRSRAQQLHLSWAQVLQWLLGAPVKVSYQRSAGELSPAAKPSSGSCLP